MQAVYLRRFSALPSLLLLVPLLMIGGYGETVQASPGTPAQGGTLVVAIAADPGHLNPAITTSGATHAAAELLYNGLLGRDEHGDPLPELAESWQVEQDGTVYRFRLREDVTWHDGTPFTAADVKFTFEEVLLKFHARTKASMGGALVAIEAPDAHTVVFRFAHSYAPFLQQLDATEAPLLPRHIYQGTDPQTNPANVHPIGTGPFQFVSYKKGAEIRLARHPAYFKKALPYLDEVVIRVIPEATIQVLALENGEVDFLWGVPGPHQRRLRRDPRVRLAQTAFNPGGSNCTMTVSFNLERPLLQEPRLRQAIASALDRELFLRQVLFEEGKVASAPLSSAIAWAHAHDLSMPAFDRSTAERLLDASGWKKEGEGGRVARGVVGIPEGTRLALDFVYFPTFAKYGELFRQQLGAVGIAVTLRPLEPAAFAPTVFKERDFDTNIISYCQGPDPEIGMRRMYHSAQIGTAPFTNAAAYRNPQVDALFEWASRTLDRPQRAQYYRQLQEIVVQELPYYWLVETLSTRAWSARCAGFRPWTGLFAETAFCKREASP